MRTGRPKTPLVVSREERETLESVAHRSRTAPQLARRARIVLACADGFDNKVGGLQGGGASGGNVLLGDAMLTIGGNNGVYAGAISGSGGHAAHSPSSLRRLRPAKTFASTFITSTNAISTSAAAHAAACSSGEGDSEKTKIVTGSVGRALATSKETALAAIEDVNRSGAVSPATRATATRCSSATR